MNRNNSRQGTSEANRSSGQKRDSQSTRVNPSNQLYQFSQQQRQGQDGPGQMFSSKLSQKYGTTANPDCNKLTQIEESSDNNSVDGTEELRKSKNSRVGSKL